MKLKTRQIIAHGRLREAQEADNAMLAAITPFKDDWVVKMFKSRDAMKHFCKDGSKMHALIKDKVPSNMFFNSNMQRVAHTMKTKHIKVNPIAASKLGTNQIRVSERRIDKDCRSMPEVWSLIADLAAERIIDIKHQRRLDREKRLEEEISIHRSLLFMDQPQESSR